MSYTVLFSSNDGVKFVDSDNGGVVSPEIVLEALLIGAVNIYKRVKTVKIEDKQSETFKFYHEVTYVAE